MLTWPIFSIYLAGVCNKVLACSISALRCKICLCEQINGFIRNASTPISKKEKVLRFSDKPVPFQRSTTTECNPNEISHELGG